MWTEFNGDHNFRCYFCKNQTAEREEYNDFFGSSKETINEIKRKGRSNYNAQKVIITSRITHCRVISADM